MNEQIKNWAPWVTLAGVCTLLVGLAWDAVLHAADPELAAEEGVFTLSNPGHVIFALGIALAVAGSAMFLVGRVPSPTATTLTSRARLLAPAAGVLALAGVTFAFAASSDGGSAGSGHAHEDPAASSGQDDDDLDADHRAEEPGERLLAAPSDTASDPVGDHADDHGDSPAGASPSAGDMEGELHEHDFGIWEDGTSEERAQALAFVDEVKSATARFEDVNVALAEGYAIHDPEAAARSVGPAHYGNPESNFDGEVLDLAHPETLVYFRLPDGSAVYLGALYKATVGEGPQPGGRLMTWHSHFEHCFDAAGNPLPIESFSTCPEGATPPPNAVEMAHVWLFDHPRGPFVVPLGPDGVLAALES
jgi:hypothetical protein